MKPLIKKIKRKIKLNPKNDDRKVLFEFYAPLAGKICVAGTFNGWSTELTPLKKQRNGNWKASIALPPGRYEYRFWVDGIWENDPGVSECVPNAYGGWNCVMEVL